jgi:chromosome segregation ATPase
MERRKSIDASSAKGLEYPPSAKRRGSLGFTGPEPESQKQQEKSQDGDRKKGSFLKLEQTKLESLRENVKNQEDKDPKLAAKLGRLSENIDAVIDKTRSATDELMRMKEISKELSAQAEIQKEECKTLESDQRHIKEDIESVTKRMEILLAEKKRVEKRLEAMKDQNNKLQEFLEVRSCR